MICFFGKGLLLSTLLSLITTTSPFSISRINFAPIMSSAQVSEARINAFLNLPKTSGQLVARSKKKDILNKIIDALMQIQGGYALSLIHI